MEFSTITDAIRPTVTLTESLARLFQHTLKNPSDYPDITQMRNISDTAKDPTNPGVGEGATTSTNTTTPLFSPPGTDLRMDWGDACSLGYLPDLNRYFLQGGSGKLKLASRNCTGILAGFLHYF